MALRAGLGRGYLFDRKVVASDGAHTMSGWSLPRPRGYEHVAPEKIAQYAEQIGHELKATGASDQETSGGFPGMYFASHAEKQLTILRPGEPIGVTGILCTDCRQFFLLAAGFFDHGSAAFGDDDSAG